MNSAYLNTAIDSMRKAGIEFAPGLTQAQIVAIESRHGFRFPPDLRSFLEFALPLGDAFPDWRDPDSKSIAERLAWPADGICFDIEHNGFWLTSWGPKPDSLAEAQATAREAVRAAPFLIPIYAHRYLPAKPCEKGNPVFSIYQTDIICYGVDLPSYFFAEFQTPNPFLVPGSPREIELWSELERRNG